MRVAKTPKASLRIALSDDEIDALRESLDYSIRNVSDWHAHEGAPETLEVGRAKVAFLARLRQRLTALRRASSGATPPGTVPSEASGGREGRP
jgi:hypothetical protein